MSRREMCESVNTWTLILAYSSITTKVLVRCGCSSHRPFIAGHVSGPAHLYFGCRSKTKDYYYKEQFEAMLQEGVLASENGLQVACSRESSEKVYVQQLLAQNSRQLFRLICEVQQFFLHAWNLLFPICSSKALSSWLCHVSP